MGYMITVVVPVYNVGQYLKQCINSILGQTYSNIEIILVDDESTDSSGEICESYANLYKNIKVIHKKNAGLGMARNTGIDNASGDYITFIDGDDYIEKNHLDELLTSLKDNDSDVCYGGYKEQLGDNYYPHPNPCSPKVFQGKAIIKEIIPRMCGRLSYLKHDEISMSVCMALYSMHIIRSKSLRFQSERNLISEDLVFNMEFLSYAGIVSFSESCGYLYRKNYNSLTKQYLPDRLEKQIIMTKYVVNKSKEVNVYEESRQRILSTFLFWVRHIVKSEQRNYINVGFSQSIGRIREVCNNQFVIDSIKNYDETMLTFKPRLLHNLIKRKQCLMIWIFSAFHK